jgi:xylan 1,4-beta-xylosidase
MQRRTFLTGTAIAAGATAFPVLGVATPESIAVRIRAKETTGPLDHIWNCVGSDRAAITMRESWRHDIDRAREEIGIKRVRFHGILNDELGVLTRYPQHRDGTANFRNVAEVYDGLVDRGLAPFVELGFMPSELASGSAQFGFYKGNITPPKSFEAWGAFIGEFTRFIVDRYGLGEVARWPIEVWNEPDLPFFFTGKQDDYFQLYKHAAVAIKGVSPRLQVGGPVSSGAKWIPGFLSFCASENAPVDFVSTHSYAGHMGGPKDSAPQMSVNDVIPTTIRGARQAIAASGRTALPLYINEWSADSPAMIAHVLTHVLGDAQMMSHWVLSGTYEELGPSDYLLQEGAMGWSLMQRGIPRPAYNTYRLLHRLGQRRVFAQGPALASSKANGKLSALVWNLAEVPQAAGIPGADATRNVVGSAKRLVVTIEDMKPGQALQVTCVDQNRGSPFPAWRKMGSPKLPTSQQIAFLRAAAELPAPSAVHLDANRQLRLDLPPEGVALIEAV